MLISEILLRKEHIEDKIEELNRFIGRVVVDNNKSGLTTVFNNICKLYDELQSYKVLLSKNNRDNIINVAGSSVSITDALLVLKTLENKISIITNIIDNNGGDLFQLMNERDILFDEYITLLSAVRVSDWTTNAK